MLTCVPNLTKQNTAICHLSCPKNIIFGYFAVTLFILVVSVKLFKRWKLLLTSLSYSKLNK